MALSVSRPLPGNVARITDIQPHKKHPYLFSIFIDNKFTFSLSDTELAAAGLKVDQTISQIDIERFQQQAQVSRGQATALNLLSRRQYSAYEVQQYLKRKKYSESSIAAIIQKLEQSGYIDDFRFAGMWVDNRNLLKPRSKRQLQAELRQKGIDRETIDEMLSQIDDRKEIENIQKIITKKKKNPRYHDRQKLTEFLLRQGFSYAAVQDAFAGLAAREYQSQGDAD